MSGQSIRLGDVTVILTKPDPEYQGEHVDAVVHIDTSQTGPAIRVRINDDRIYEGTPGIGEEQHRHDAINGHWIYQRRPRPVLPDMGSRSWWGTAIDAVWSTDEPEPSGAFTAYLLSMTDEGDQEYSVTLISWNEATHQWLGLNGDDYPNLMAAIEQWKRVTE